MSSRDMKTLVFYGFLIGQHVCRDVPDESGPEAHARTWGMVREVAEGDLTFIDPGGMVAPFPDLKEDVRESVFRQASDMRTYERRAARLILEYMADSKREFPGD